ncbi:hypothetical protein [Streptomyces sparsogenes]|uniref:hypothetical protein n=1 Tax=Streptomyces sparsogenes TaxID=67365 RepID=UPI000978DBAE|nr:hypothetical protein [Streptomyces sparsogenes]
MEQRIGPSTPPVPAAGFDPAFIPGLTAPRPAEEETPDEKAEQQPLQDADAAAEAETRAVDAVAEDGAGNADDAEAKAGTDEAGTAKAVRDGADTAEDAPEKAAPDEDDTDGPVFEAADRRASISAGRRGVTLHMDGETAEFDWDEVGAVEIDTPRFGRRFSVTVYTTARRWYEAEVQAPARSALKTWTAELDAVLDAYFEDAKPSEAKPSAAKPSAAKPSDAKPSAAKPSDTDS